MNIETVFLWLGEHIALFYIPLIVWQTKTLLKMHQTVYGENGDNGLKGDTKRLREARHVHSSALQEHEGRLNLHENRLDRNEEDITRLQSRGPERRSK